jgi:hypothetical protein
VWYVVSLEYSLSYALDLPGGVFEMNRRAFVAMMSALGVTSIAVPQIEGDTSDPTPDHKVVLKEGTEVKLKFSQELTSKTAAEGDPVNFVLDEDVKAGDAVLIRAGAKAVGTVTNAKKAGMMGKGGELNIRLEHLRAGENRVRLRGSRGKEGDSKTGTAIALTVLFGPIGLIKHGKDIVVKEGTPLTAYVDDDISLPATQ